MPFVAVHADTVTGNAHPNPTQILSSASILLRTCGMQMETFLLPSSGHHSPACLSYARQDDFGVSPGEPSPLCGPHLGSHGTPDLQYRRRSNSALEDVQDLLKLSPKHLVKSCLQELFRRFDCIKLGFGIEGDLCAVSAAIGKEGGGCVSRLHSVVDLRYLHRSLARLGAAVPFVSGHGLSGMVSGTLSRPLNKSQQCSTWHVRPLSEEQLAYAANDAAVLLELFDAFVTAAPPAAFPIVRSLNRPTTAQKQVSNEAESAADSDETQSLVGAPGRVLRHLLAAVDVLPGFCLQDGYVRVLSYFNVHQMVVLCS